MPNNEENISTLQYMQRYYQNQYLTLERNIEESYSYINEMKETQVSLKNMDKVSSKEILNPIGTNAYITAKTGKIESVLMGVGAGFYAEKSIKEANEFVESVIDRQNKFIQKLTEDKEGLEHTLLKIANNLDKISDKT